MNSVEESDIIRDYCKNPVFTGCMKRCPCRTWVQCPTYIDMKEQQKRLKRKQIHDSKLQDILQWYEDNFREHFNCQCEMSNG